MPEIFIEDSGNLKTPYKCEKCQQYHRLSSSQLSCYTKARQYEGVRKRGALKNTCSWKSKIKSK